MKQTIITRIGLAFGFLSIILFAGCWMSVVPIIDPAAAKVNPAFVGNWDNPDQFESSGREAGLVIRNIDGKQYYVEWKTKGETNELVRAVAHTTEIRNATFAQLRGLVPDGKVEVGGWLICRIDLTGNKITIRQLNDEFLKARTVNTSAALRQVLEQNLDNEAMYNPKETLTATKKESGK